jgi:hypothetical protein
MAAKAEIDRLKQTGELGKLSRVEITTAKGTFSPPMPPVHAMRQQALNFLAAIRGEIKPMCEAREAVEDLRIARDHIRLLERD